MTPSPLTVLVVEDEMLLAAELEFLVEDAGYRQVGHATTADKAIELAHAHHPDLALIDVHLGEGPTGVDVAREVVADCDVLALFMTANVKRLPGDFAGACGVIGKPYSEHAMRTSLRFLEDCLRLGVAPGLPPPGLQIAPTFETRWAIRPVQAA